MIPANYLYIFSNGKLAALSKADGSIVWEVKLKDYIGTGLSHSIGQLMQDGDKLYVGCAGYIICLAAKDGSLIWANKLKGWGWQFVTLANTTVESNASAIAAQQAAAIAAS